MHDKDTISTRNPFLVQIIIYLYNDIRASNLKLQESAYTE